MKRQIALTSFLLFILQGAAADEIALNAQAYEWGQPVKYEVSVIGSYGYYLEVRHRFTWENTGSRSDAPATKPVTETVSGEFDTSAWSPSVSDLSRNYYDIVLLSQDASGAYEETARETVLVLRKLPKMPAGRISWSFENGATLMPGAKTRVDVSRSANRDAISNPTIQLTKLGRVLPGGAVEPDQLSHEQPVELGRTLDRIWTNGYADGERLDTYSRQLLPANAITVRSGGGALLEGAWITRNANDPLAVVSEEAQHDANKVILSLHGALSPIPIGPYVARILGPGNTVISERSFTLLPPRQDGAIEFVVSGDEPFEEIPGIFVNRKEPSLPASELSVSVVRLGRRGIQVSTNGGEDDYPIRESADGSLQVDLRGPLRSGRYRVSLYLAQQKILLDRREFDYEQPGDQRTLWPAPIKPLIDPEDVSVLIQSGAASVLGDNIRIQVLDERGRPLKTAPLVAELFFSGHHTFGCFWREGYYTGAAGLVDENGLAEFPAPGETGRYEVRVFRPMDEIPVAGFSGSGNIRVARPFPGHVSSPENMELVGITALDVFAPAAEGIVGLAAVKLATAFNVTVTNPGRAYQDHAMNVSLWRSNGRSVGGEPTRPVRLSAFDIRGEDLDSNGSDIFPFVARFPGIREPGDFEIRVRDLTTGLYIARQQFSLRDGSQPPLPAFAHYEMNVPTDDWPQIGDPLRDIAAWMPPVSECADPLFDDPPQLEIVELWPNDLRTTDDDEYRVPSNVWPGHPYLVQARFETAPPDDSYRLKIDGERRVTVYRTPGDPRIYRSGVVTFVENQND